MSPSTAAQDLSTKPETFLFLFVFEIQHTGRRNTRARSFFKACCASKKEAEAPFSCIM